MRLHYHVDFAAWLAVAPVLLVWPSIFENFIRASWKRVSSFRLIVCVRSRPWTMEPIYKTHAMHV